MYTERLFTDGLAQVAYPVADEEPCSAIFDSRLVLRSS